MGSLFKTLAIFANNPKQCCSLHLQLMVIDESGVNPNKHFFVKRTFFPFFAIKLGHFIEIALFIRA
jgi:hypothetical protein